MRPHVRVVAVGVAFAAGVLAGCGGGAGGDGRSIDVFAAASLTGAFTELADTFEDAHPGVGVELRFAGSSSLREQILDGAPADVVASANMAIMDELVDAGAVGAPLAFATNRLQIAVPAGNPADVTGLADLADDDLLVGLCAEEVPCGALAVDVFAAAGVVPAVDTEEPDVRALLTKVVAGELDAGVVYVTDVLAAGDDVEGIDIDAPSALTTTYPIAVDADGGGDDALAFVDFVLGREGRRVLEAHGFGPP